MVLGAIGATDAPFAIRTDGTRAERRAFFRDSRIETARGSLVDMRPR